MFAYAIPKAYRTPRTVYRWIRHMVRYGAWQAGDPTIGRDDLTEYVELWTTYYHAQRIMEVQRHIPQYIRRMWDNTQEVDR